MNIRDCQRILQVPPGAGLDEVKAAFRRLAFTLHPDLNPSPDAAAKFRQLNEAYVLLSKALKDGEAGQSGGPRAQGTAAGNGAAAGPAGPSTAQEKARKAKAGKAYAKGQDQARGSGWGAGWGFGGAKDANKEQSSPGATRQENAKQPGPKAGFHIREEEVLRDLLSDPFARQVFEDIYSQLKHTNPRHGQGNAFDSVLGRAGANAPAEGKRRRLEISWGDKTLGLDLGKGLVGGVKSWLRGQLDDEQTVYYPPHAIGPGRTLRLTVSARFGEAKTIEITLPPDFVVGRPVRLRGLGRKLGPFTGDLYLRVLAK